MFRKSIYTLIGTLWLWHCGFDSSPEPSTTIPDQPELRTPSTTAKKIDFQNTDATWIAKNLYLKVPTEYTYSGYYHLAHDAQGKPVLQGHFRFKYSQKINVMHELNSETKIIATDSFEYTGQFYKNRKRGSFIERRYLNDHVDLYASWQIALYYKPEKESCQLVLLPFDF